MTLNKRPFENIVGKGENAGNQHVAFQNVAFTPQKKASAPRKFEMEMKQLTFTSFHFENLSNDFDKQSPSTLGENTDACQFPTFVDPKEHCNVSF